MYLYISGYIHIYIYICLYIYILKKEHNILRSFAFFCKRTKRSHILFTFFAKEQNILCILLRSLQKNVAFFVFFYVLKKRTQKNALFF